MIWKHIPVKRFAMWSWGKLLQGKSSELWRRMIQIPKGIYNASLIGTCTWNLFCVICVESVGAIGDKGNFSNQPCTFTTLASLTLSGRPQSHRESPPHPPTPRGRFQAVYYKPVSAIIQQWFCTPSVLQAHNPTDGVPHCRKGMKDHLFVSNKEQIYICKLTWA